MNSPLDPNASEETWLTDFRQRAREAWGPARASAIDDTVCRAALAVRRLSQIEFDPAEPPAFYLDQTGGRLASEE